MTSAAFAGYRGARGDEAVDADGRVRAPWAPVGAALDRLGTAALDGCASTVAGLRAERDVVVGSWRDGRHILRPLPMDPVPRALPADEWARVAAGVEQRHRALNAFLADAYRAAGRRRSDPDRAPLLVRAGVLPEWAVAHSPSREPEAVGLAWPEQPRATVAAVDLARTATGSWVVLGDDLRVPAGLGYALTGRDVALDAAPALFAGAPGGLVDPWTAVPLLVSALQDAAPPSCTGTPACAVLSPGDADGTWFEHRLLAEALGAPIVHPADLWPRPDGGIETVVDGERFAVDVLYRRLGDGELPAHRSATGQPLLVLLAEAVRTGRLGLANVPGNGLADEATYAWVPAMIRFYLDEEPLLGSVPTWVLADDAQWAEVRDRLHELVLVPVGGYGGHGVVVGPDCSPAELAQVQAEVAAAPHRFVAQEPVDFSTVPVLEGGRLVPRPVDLRVFSVAGAATRALPAPLTRVGTGRGARAEGVGEAVKDTWLLP